MHQTQIHLRGDSRHIDWFPVVFQVRKTSREPLVIKHHLTNRLT